MSKFLIIIAMVFLSGCVFGRPSAGQGSATFSIPFDFSQSDKQVSQESELDEEVIKLEAEMIMQKKLEQIKGQE